MMGRPLKERRERLVAVCYKHRNRSPLWNAFYGLVVTSNTYRYAAMSKDIPGKISWSDSPCYDYNDLYRKACSVKKIVTRAACECDLEFCERSCQDITKVLSEAYEE